MDGRVGVGEALEIEAEQVVLLVLGQKGCEGGVGVGKDAGQAVQEPVELGGAAEKDAAQDEAGDAVGMGLGVGEGEGGAPGAAEKKEALDAQMFAQGLDVGDQVGGGVVVQAAERARPAGAALVEDHDAPEGRIEEAAVDGAGAGAGAAVEEQDGAALRVADLLPIHDVAAGERQVAGLERSDFREQVASGHGRNYTQMRGGGEITRGVPDADRDGARNGVRGGGRAGATGVAMGAVAAHAVLDAHRQMILRQGVEMQMWHALALLGAGAALRRADRWAAAAVAGLVVGTALFCGGVYGLAAGLDTGRMAPVGGSLLIGSWLVLGVAGWRCRAG